MRNPPVVRRPAWRTTSWPCVSAKGPLKSTTTSPSAQLPEWVLVKVLVTHWALNFPVLPRGLGTAFTTTTHYQPLSAAHASWVAGSTSSSGAKTLPSWKNLKPRIMLSVKQQVSSVFQAAWKPKPRKMPKHEVTRALRSTEQFVDRDARSDRTIRVLCST